MKFVIVGAVAGGASTAARLRRRDEKSEIVIFEKGDYISYANCGLPYYIGDVIKDRNKLFIQSAGAFHKRFSIDVRVNSEVLAVNTINKTVSAKNLVSGEVYEESYDKLVLSPGAEPVRPELPGIRSDGIFTLRTVADTDIIKSYVSKKNVKRAVVVGAGFIGLEMAENLHALGMSVTIVELGNQILAPIDATMAAIAQDHIRSKNVELMLSTGVTGFAKENDVIKVSLNTGNILEADVVILSIGVRPDTKLAKPAGLKIGTTGGIWVNEYLQTSDPAIYAVGDAIEFPNPVTKQPALSFLAGPANKQGRICADNLVDGNKHAYHGAVNTAIVKVFDMTVATSGTASKNLRKAGIKHFVSNTYSASHAGYYPGAKNLSIQLVFSPDDGTLYGAQICGYDGVDKRIDVLSSVIQRKSTVYELTEFEQAYAPPFSSAKDPVNMAGFVAENILTGKHIVFYKDETSELEKDSVLLDVRTSEEFAVGKINSAINIPLDDLRDRLSELDPKKKTYIYCQAGMRGYLAQQILMQNGFADTLNLSGGYYLWSK